MQRHIRSSSTHSNHLFALYKLANQIDDPPRTRVRSRIKSAIQFRQLPLPPTPRQLILPLLCHTTFVTHKHHRTHKHQHLFYQHSLRLHNNIIQPDTLYHNQCNHSVQPQLSHSLLLQLHNNNHNNLWDTPSNSQHKHHLPTLRLHNLHPFTLSTHNITAQPCHVFSHHHITTQPYPIFSCHHHNMDHSSLTSLYHSQQAQH